MGAAVGIGLQGFSMIIGAMGESAAYKHKEAESKRAAEIGRINADQISSSYLEDLTTTISNIRAIRAATGANPDSPSSVAFIEGEAKASDRARRIKAGAARIGANTAERDAQFYRSSARMALLGGIANAAGSTIMSSMKLAGGF